MRVVTKSSIYERIVEAVSNVEIKNRKIDHIELTESEYLELSEFGHCEWKNTDVKLKDSGFMGVELSVDGYPIRIVKG